MTALAAENRVVGSEHVCSVLLGALVVEHDVEK